MNRLNYFDSDGQCHLHTFRPRPASTKTFTIFLLFSRVFRSYFSSSVNRVTACKTFYRAGLLILHSSLLGTSGATFTFSVVSSLYMKQILLFTIVGVTGKFRVNQIAAFAESFPTNFLIFISSSGCLIILWSIILVNWPEENSHVLHLYLFTKLIV